MFSQKKLENRRAPKSTAAYLDEASIVLYHIKLTDKSDKCLTWLLHISRITKTCSVIKFFLKF